MRQATQGDRVRVHYTGTLDTGTQFDSSREGEPMEVNIGEGRLIKPFEYALHGMGEGDAKQIAIQPEDAYGVKLDAMIHVVTREQLPPSIDIHIGMALEATDPNGNPVNFRVAKIDGDNISLDANHPLAGQVLTFDIELVGFIGEAA
jgi:peptidylprolyl isomerase